jgi:hypothetical protein
VKLNFLHIKKLLLPHLNSSRILILFYILCSKCGIVNTPHFYSTANLYINLLMSEVGHRKSKFS